MTNRYEDIGRRMLEDQERALASTVQYAAQTTPQQEADVWGLAQRTGAPPDAVRADPEGARLAAERRALADLSPTTQKWLTENPNRYALVKDELGTLDKLGLAISRSFRTAKDHGISAGWRTYSDHIRSWDSIGEGGAPSHRPAADPFYVEELGTALLAGYQRALGNAALATAGGGGGAYADMVAQGLGFESDAAYQAARSAGFAAQQERRAQQIERTSAATDEQFQNIAAANEADSVWEALGLVAQSPRAAGVVVAQSLGMGASGLAMTAATGGTSRLLTAGTAGGSSGWVEYGASISESLADAGVDTTNATEVARALRNPEIMAAARSRAAKRSVPIALFDAATAGLAGQLLINARRGAASAALRTAGEGGIQAAGGSLGELTAGLAAGEGVQLGDVILEGIAEVPFGAVEARANYVTARERGQVRWINEQLDIVRRSSEGSDALQAATAAAAEANLGKRSAAEAQAFARASGAEGAVYIDAEAARTLFQDNWQVLAEAVGGDAALAEQLASGDVAIPAEQYFGVVSQLPNAQEIARNARTQADALSAVELEQYDIDALADAMAGDTSEAADRARPAGEPDTRQRVQDDIYGQLIATDRYTPAAAEAQAKLWGAFFASIENRYGVDGWEAYQARMRGVAAGNADGRPDPRRTRRWDGPGRLDALLDSIRSGEDPDPRHVHGPSLVQWLRDQGGVVDESGELRGRDAGKQVVGLVNSRGMTLDRARELAAEAGFFGDDTGESIGTTTVADFLDLIDRDLRSGDVFSPAMSDQARQQFEAERVELQAALDEIEYFRDMPAEQFRTLTNQQIADVLFGGDALNFDQPAFHGTPHTVDRFSLQRIGSGEGNQAFGWGLYFAGRREVAEWYAENARTAAGFGGVILSTPVEHEMRRWMQEADRNGDSMAAGVYDELLAGDFTPDILRRQYADSLRDGEIEQSEHDQAVAAIERAEQLLEGSGNVYRVDIPEDSDLLDWDAPLSEQPEKVRAALEPEIADLRARALEQESGWGEMAAPDRAEENITGQFIYRVLADDLGPQGASQRLLELGIPGLRYLDGDSRGSGDGSRNYVIWDAAAISDPVRVDQDGLPQGFDESAYRPEVVAWARERFGDVVAPNGNPAWQNFVAWFGDSQVVDGEGRPLVVYHGTSRNFDSFDPTRSGEKDSGWYGKGFYFTADHELASAYSGYGEVRPGGFTDGSNMMPVYLSIQNPYVWPEGRQAAKTPEETAALTAELLEAGHDGVIVPNVFMEDGVRRDFYEVIAFRPEQVKSATGNRGTFDPADASILNQDDLGDRLVAVHNLSEANLLFSDALGGLPAPSIGITKAATPFRGFGSISLIGSRALAEPSTTNPVFSADAYTQRFPEVLWPRVKAGKAEKFLAGMDDIDQVWEYLVNTPDRDRAIEVAVRSSGFMRAWLRAQGDEPVQDVTRGAQPRSPWMADPQLLAVVEGLQERGVYLYDLPPDSPEAREIAEAARGAIQRHVESAHQDPQIRERLRLAYEGEQTFDPEGGLRYSVQDQLVSYAARRARAPQVDRYATQQALAEQIGERQAQFEAWVAEQVSAQFDEPKIQLGRRKVPMTLENVVEAMTRQRAVAGRESTMTFSSGQVAARNAKRYRTIEEIQADRDLVVSPDDQQAARDNLEAQLSAFRDAAVEHFTGTNYRGEIDTWEALDSSMKALADAAKKPATAANVAAALRRNGFEGFPDEVAQAGADALVGIRQAVTDYFEAKPQRAVALSEFAGAVIPADAQPEVREVLDRHGIRWMEYGDGLTQEQAVAQLSAELDGGTGEILFQPDGAQPARPPRGQLQIFPDRSMSISLFEKADRSTFLHESGHFFLEVLRDLSAMEDAPQQVRDDMATLLAWFGVESPDQIAVEHHEQFARGFEKYLGEGRAPSPELQSVFSQFKAWLLSIYRDLLNLNVELTDDVRGVMDRMLAADEEIEAAHVRQGMEPMTFGEGVLEEDQIRDYADQLAQATERERAALAARLMAAHDRAARRWYREQKAAVREEVEAEYAAMPVYRAARVLAGAKTYADGTPIPPELQDMKLSKDALVAVYGESYLQRIRGMYRVTGGVDQDVAAMRLGFDSGDALVTALANREDMDARVAAETDERMRERYGDPMTDGTLAERAMDAVHGDYRMRVLAWEMAVLEALAADPAATQLPPRPRRDGQEGAQEAQEGQADTPRREISPETRERIRQAQARRTAATRALAEAARRAIAKKTLRDVRPHDYLAAERKAARKATAAAAAGRYVEGLQAKRQQAFNAAMYREAMRVQKRADANVRFLRKAASEQTRKRIGKDAGKFYVDALDAIFDGIEVRGVSRPQVARRAALREWVARMQDDGNSTAVPEMLLARVESERVTNLADMTVADVEGLREAVENILHLARVKNRLQTAKGQREWEDVKAEMMERLAQQPDRHGRGGISDADRALFERIRDLYAAGSNWVLQPETVVEWLDGGTTGPFHDLIWDMAQAAERKREALNRQVGEALQEALDAMPAQERKALDRRFHVDSLGAEVSGHSILSALLNMGNEGNRDKLLRGGRVVGDEIVPFTPEQLAEMFSKLSRPQAEVVQKVWDAIDQLWPEIVALEESMNGISPERVQASAFTVITRDGPVALRGGYYPVMYDPKGARVGQFSEDEEAKRVLSGQTPIRASTSKGHTEKRTDFAAPLLLDYHSVITRHLDGVIGDIAYRQLLRQVYKVLGDADIRRMIDNRIGPGAATGLRQSIERGAVGYYSLAGPLLGPFQKVADAGMTNLSSAALGFRIPLAMANVVAVPLQAGARVKPRFILRGLRDYYLSGGPNIIGNMRRNAEMVRRLSPLMQRRAEARSVELSSIIANLRGKRGFRAKMIEMAMAMHNWTVPLAENAVWMGAYQQAQAGGASVEDAVRAADKAIRQTQTKTSAAELSRGEGGPMRMFMQFAGPLVIMNNRMQEAGMRGLRGDVHSWPQALGVWFAVATGAAWSFELMMGRGPEGDDGEEPDVGDWIGWAALKLALLPFAAYPLIRDVASFVDSGFSRGTPLAEAGISIYEATIGTAQELFSEDEVDPEKIIKAQVRASGAAFGVPSNQLLRTGDYLMSIGTGEHEVGNPAAEAYYFTQGAPDED